MLQLGRIRHSDNIHHKYLAFTKFEHQIAIAKSFSTTMYRQLLDALSEARAALNNETRLGALLDTADGAVSSQVTGRTVWEGVNRGTAFGCPWTNSTTSPTAGPAATDGKKLAGKSRESNEAGIRASLSMVLTWTSSSKATLRLGCAD